MLNLICALKHEASPIVDHFQLVHDGPGRPFVTYRDTNGRLSLTITGAGKQAAAAGTRYAIQRFPADPSDAWLNVGIAGHKALATGTPVLAGSVTDYASGQAWHPRIDFNAGLITLPLVTVDQPLTGYPDNAMVDMEAAGFFSSACTIGSMERIHCLKIISDNVLNPARNISKQTVIKLVSENIKTIDVMVSYLHTHSGKPVTGTS